MHLREIARDRLAYEVVIGERVRLATVLVRGKWAMFPHVMDESGETLGWPELDARLAEDAQRVVLLRSRW